MEIVQPNLALSATADRIREPKFNTVRRGYDPNQVLEYLSRVADRVQALEDQASQLVSQLQGALKERDEALASPAPVPDTPDTPDNYESVSSRVSELMVGLDKDVERIRGQAQADAEHIIVEATGEAFRIQTQAERLQAAAKQTLMQAENEAERATSMLTSRQESVRSELRATCSQVLKLIADLEEAIGLEQDEEPIVLEEHGDEAPDAPVMEPTSLPDAPQ
jgi:DivIVA domain-containing protein